MKKLFMLLLIIFMLVGCETQEERDARKKSEEIKKINESLTTSEIPEETRQWLVDTKMENVITVFCITSSKKCEELSNTIEEVKKNNGVITHIINLDTIADNVKNVYKTTYELKDYTGYLPYIFITSKEELLYTHTDIISQEELINVLKENEIVQN